MIGDPGSPPSPTYAPDPVLPPAVGAGVEDAGVWFSWTAAVVGGLLATAIVLVLTVFGKTLGFADLTHTWREVTPGLAILSGVWLLMVALAAAAVGGYMAGRLRGRWGLPFSDEVQFRDGTHGAVAWSIAIILGAVLTAVAAGPSQIGAVNDPAVPASADVLGAPTLIITRETDRLLSGGRAGITDAPLRTAVGRLLTTGATDRVVNQDDRSELIRVVSAATGVAPADAARRVDASLTVARKAVASTHHAQAIGAFITAAALLVAGIMAWFAAESGGRHREAPNAPSLMWSPRRVRLIVR